MLVDSHCHLDFPDYAGEVDGVVARARAAGVGVCVTIGTELKRFPGVRAVAEKFPDVWCSVGVHPHEAEKELLDRCRRRCWPRPPIPRWWRSAKPGWIIITNIRRARRSSANFRAHIAAARKAGLPVIVHTRDADDDTIAMLEDEMGKGAFTGLIHCFTGTQRLADAALALGLYISVSGIATFKNSGSPARCDQDRAAGPAAGGDRCAVPGAGAAPGQDQRAGLCRAYRQRCWRS